MENTAALGAVADAGSLRRQLDAWLEQAFEPVWAPIVWPALIRLCARLRGSLPPGEWEEVRRQLRAHDISLLAGEEPLVRLRREGASEATLLDQAAGHAEAPAGAAAISPAGRDLHAVTMALPFFAAWRERTPLVARMVEAATERSEGAEILTLDAGHLREAEAVTPQRPMGRWLVLESDPLAHPVLRRQRERIRQIKTRVASSPSFLRRPGLFGEFDLIQAVATLPRLADAEARALAEQGFAQLKPGGVLLLASPAARLREAAYLDAFLDWRPQGRDEGQMAGLLAGLPEEKLLRRHVFAAPRGGMVYAVAIRRL
jgi:hypothetical protein